MRTVDAAPAAVCVPTSACRVAVVSSGVSPATTRTGPRPSSATPVASRPSSATRTAWPVPFCCSCTTASAAGAIAARCSVTRSRPCPTTTTRCSGSRPATEARTCPRRLRPAISWRTFGVVDTMRVPSPAARTTTADGRGLLTRASLLSRWAGEAGSPYPAPGPGRSPTVHLAEPPRRRPSTRRSGGVHRAPGAGIEPASYPHSKCGRPCQQSNPGRSRTTRVERRGRPPEGTTGRPVPGTGPRSGRMRP